MAAGSLSLGDVASRTADLAVACTRCYRAGRYHLAKLIDRHGSAFPVPELLRLLSADCPKRASVSAYDVCGAHFPELYGLFRQKHLATKQR
jgi:hypothetical protein